MKHAHVNTHANFRIGNGLYWSSLLLGLVWTLTACQKQPIDPPPAESGQTAMQSQAAPNDSIFIRITVSKNGVLEREYVQNNLKQMSLAMHYHEYGSIRDILSFEYNAKGLLTAARLKNGGTYLYSHNANGRIIGYKYFETNNTNAQPVSSGPYRWDSVALLTSVHHNNRAGKLESSTHYSYHPNGQIAMVEEYSYTNGKQLKRRVRLDHQASAEQVQAWKNLAAMFPQPELPWDILTLLSTRIEEGSRSADDVWVEGKIITAENMVFNHDNLVQSKTLVYPPDPKTNSRPHETMTLGFTKIEYND